MRLSFDAVTTDQQFRDLLLIRNECRNGLTHYKREISLGEQYGWRTQCWGHQDPSSSWKNEWYEPYILYEDSWPMAYGMLKWDGEKYWMTVGVAKDYRRKGLGKLVANLITEIGHRDAKEVWLDVTEDNPMLETYIDIGYEFVESNMDGYNTIHIMRHMRDQNLRPQELFWLHNHQESQS